jgi:hypothetical protein
VIMIQCLIIDILKSFILCDKILAFYFLLTFSKTKIDCCSIMDIAVLPVLTKQTRDLSLQQDASRLQTSADIWSSSRKATSPLRMHFPLLNPTELYDYRVTCTVVLPRIKL